MSRAATTAVRAQVASERDEQAKHRDENARHRDQIAVERDRSAAGADEVAGQLAWAVEDPQGKTRVALDAAAHVRGRAASTRTKAALDREAAARDRADAARDRELLLTEIEHSYMDVLTGAYGRGMGEVLLRHEIERAGRAEGSLALALIDIDHLKLVNDGGGDPAGDALLCDVFAALKANLRPYDPIVRWEDDAFVCAISDSTPGNPDRCIEDVRAAIAKLHPGVSISAGVAALKVRDGLATVIERAEAALIEDKRS